MLIEPTILSEYSKDRDFGLFEATSIYDDSYLLYRAVGSSLGLPGDPGPTSSIDLIFLGTKYVDLPIELRGVRISKLREDKTKELSNLFDPGNPTEPDERVYTIESEGKRFYVVAPNFWIHEHN